MCSTGLQPVPKQVRKVLVVAAEARELSGLLRQLDRCETLSWPVSFGRRGTSNGVELTLVANGPGPKLAGAALHAAHAVEESNAVVSFGFCGALDPSLRVGDVFVATRVDSVEDGRSYPAVVPEAGCEFHQGRLLSTDRFASTVAEKTRLRQLGADAVDMEAAAVAAWANREGIDFYCIRAVTDTAEESFRVDFNAARDHEGRFLRGRIARQALSRPWSRVPELVRLERNCRLAARNLGEFFADCRF
jgi:adenosylhomocysteine nucleosidase